MQNKETKEERLKLLKKLYNQRKITYKQYMLETKRVEKYWKDEAQTADSVELPENPEEGGFVAAEPKPVTTEPEVSVEEVELPENPEL